MDIKERFFIYRVKNDLTQEQLAERLGTMREVVNRIENGNQKPGKFLIAKFFLLEKGEE